LKSARDKCDITYKTNTSELPLTSQQKPWKSGKYGMINVDKKITANKDCYMQITYPTKSMDKWRPPKKNIS
jgi:hypothetical protein